MYIVYKVLHVFMISFFTPLPVENSVIHVGEERLLRPPSRDGPRFGSFLK